MAKKTKPDYSAISDEPGWLEAADWQETNAAWLQISAEITAHVLELLDEKAWSKATLAKKLKVSPQQVTKILNGKANLQLSTIAKLQEALGVKLIATRFAYPWKDHLLPEFESADLRQFYDDSAANSHRVFRTAPSSDQASVGSFKAFVTWDDFFQAPGEPKAETPQDDTQFAMAA